MILYIHHIKISIYEKPNFRKIYLGIKQSRLMKICKPIWIHPKFCIEISAHEKTYKNNISHEKFTIIQVCI